MTETAAAAKPASHDQAQTKAPPGPRDENLAAGSTNPFANPTYYCWAILILGAILRIGRFVHYRCLWLDEIYLAESVTTRGFHDLLFKPLEDWQAAPAGFLFLTRLCVAVLGPTERALRLTSLLFSLASLPLFAAVARRCLSTRGHLIAVALFATLGPLIYYGNELKQYSCDVVVALAVALAMLRLIEKPDFARLTTAAIVGSIGVFFSHPGVFVLAGSGGVTLLILWLKDRGSNDRDAHDAARDNPQKNDPQSRNRPAPGRIAAYHFAIVCIIWLFAFAINYLLFIRPLTGGVAHPHLVAFWENENGYMPHSIRFGTLWIFDRLWSICSNPGSMWLAYPDVAFAAILIGFVAILLFKRQPLLVVLAPLPVAILASLLKQYPFGDRLTLFIVPALLLAIAYAIDLLWNMSIGRLAAIVLLATILLPSAWRALGYLTDPPGREESLPVYQWVASHWAPGDGLYLSCFAEKSYRYYKSAAGWPSDPEKTGHVFIQIQDEDHPRVFEQQPKVCQGLTRVWVVMIHVDGGENVVRPFTLAGFDNIGYEIPELERVYEFPGADVYCYDCTEPTPLPDGPP